MRATASSNGAVRTSSTISRSSVIFGCRRRSSAGMIDLLGIIVRQISERHHVDSAEDKYGGEPTLMKRARYLRGHEQSPCDVFAHHTTSRCAIRALICPCSALMRLIRITKSAADISPYSGCGPPNG